MMDLTRWFDRVHLDDPQVVGALAIHPLRLQGEPGSPYLLLHEAMETKALEVVETMRGNVNEVVARNVGNRTILILDGELIQGSKQNRVITVDTLLAPGAQLSVFVGCVEAGRWDRGEKKFESAEMMAEPMLRRATMAGKSPIGQPNQQRVWNRVAYRLDSSKTDSPSSDYSSYIKRFKERVGEVAKSLRIARDQVGILAVDSGRLIGLDLLGHPGNWNSVADRLSHSYVLGSLHGDEELNGIQAARSADEWLRLVKGAKVAPAKTEGLGTRFMLEDDALVGGGLWHDERPAHFAAFGMERAYR